MQCPAQTRTVTADTCTGSSFDTVLHSVGPTGALACNDDSCGLQSSLTFTATGAGRIVELDSLSQVRTPAGATFILDGGAVGITAQVNGGKTWNNDGTILFVQLESAGPRIYRVSDKGGEPVREFVPIKSYSLSYSPDGAARFDGAVVDVEAA